MWRLKFLVVEVARVKGKKVETAQAEAAQAEAEAAEAEAALAAQVKAEAEMRKGSLRDQRRCPKCGSRKIEVVKITGLCPLNIWEDLACECGYRWERHSQEDKQARRSWPSSAPLERLQSPGLPLEAPPLRAGE